MKEWEKKPEADKTFDDATDYFKEIISDNETYDANADGTTKRAGYKDAMQVQDADRPDTDTGDDIRSYIKDPTTSSSADKETIQQMQQPSSSVVSMTMQIQETMVAQSAQIKKMQEMMQAMQSERSGGG